MSALGIGSNQDKVILSFSDNFGLVVLDLLTGTTISSAYAVPPLASSAILVKRFGVILDSTDNALIAMKELGTGSLHLISLASNLA